MKNASEATKSASARSRERVAKAASISRLVRALRTAICSPRVRAASGTSRSVVSAVEALAGLTNTAILTALGTRSCSSPSRLAATSWPKKIDAGRIAARSGNAGDQTKLDGVFADREDDRYCCGRSFGRKRGRIAPERNDYRHATAGQVGHERWQAVVLALQPMVLDRRILALDVAGFVEPFLE